MLGVSCAELQQDLRSLPCLQVVQGYKFNVFYPDLIDRKIAPEFTVEKDPEADEFGSTCVLRFHAGPPYEVRSFPSQQLSFIC